MRMDKEHLASGLEEMFDHTLVHHGFTTYMRDYEMIVWKPADQHSGIESRYMRFLFRSCPEAVVRSALDPETWTRSMDEELIKAQPVTMESTGYVWGVRYQELYPGAEIVENSELARRWTAQVGVPFYEVNIKANAQHIKLIFADLAVEEVTAGYTPFTVGRSGDAEARASDSTMTFQPDKREQP